MYWVIYEMLGGEEVFYFLEMDVDSYDGNDFRDVGVVFFFNCFVQCLVFQVLDIDIIGNVIDWVVIQGFLFGVFVVMDMDDIFVGVYVNQFGDGIFEGIIIVNDVLILGNVIVYFIDFVDQVVINFFVMGVVVDNLGW